MIAYHITEKSGIKKFSIAKASTGMGTSFYGYGLYFALDKATCEHFYKQFPHDKDYFIYKVKIDDAHVVGENDIVKDGKTALELYADFVEESGSEESATEKMRSLGITGLKYYSVEDENSVVVYDDSIVDVICCIRCSDVLSK